MTDRRLLGAVNELQELVDVVAVSYSKANAGPTSQRALQAKIVEESSLMSSELVSSAVTISEQQDNQESELEKLSRWAAARHCASERMHEEFCDELVIRLLKVCMVAGTVAATMGPLKMSSTGTPLPPPTILTIQQLRYVATAVEIVWTWGMSGIIKLLGNLELKSDQATPTSLLVTQQLLGSFSLSQPAQECDAARLCAALYRRTNCVMRLALSKVFSSMLIQRNLSRILVSLLLVTTFPQGKPKDIVLSAQEDLDSLMFHSSQALRSACVVALRCVTRANKWLVTGGGRTLTKVIMSAKGVECVLMAYLQGVSDDPASIDLQVKVAKLITTAPAQSSDVGDRCDFSKEDYFANISVQVLDAYQLGLKLKDLVFQKVCVMMITRIAACSPDLCRTLVIEPLARPFLKLRSLLLSDDAINLSDHAASKNVIAAQNDVLSGLFALHGFLTLCPVMGPLSQALITSNAAESLIIFTIACLHQFYDDGDVTRIAADLNDHESMRGGGNSKGTTRKIDVVSSASSSSSSSSSGSSSSSSSNSSSSSRNLKKVAVAAVSDVSLKSKEPGMAASDVLELAMDTTFRMLLYCDTDQVSEWLLNCCLRIGRPVFMKRLGEFVTPAVRIHDSALSSVNSDADTITVSVGDDEDNSSMNNRTDEDSFGISIILATVAASSCGAAASASGICHLISTVKQSKSGSSRSSSVAILSPRQTLEALRNEDVDEVASLQSKEHGQELDEEPSDQLSALIKQAHWAISRSQENLAEQASDSEFTKGGGELLLRAEMIGKAVVRFVHYVESKLNTEKTTAFAETFDAEKFSTAQESIRNVASSLFVRCLTCYLTVQPAALEAFGDGDVDEKAVCAMMVLLLPSYLPMEILMKRSNFILKIMLSCIEVSVTAQMSSYR
jgi:hypothetical protein